VLAYIEAKQTQGNRTLQNYLQTSKFKGVIDCYDTLQTFLLINSFKMFDISLYF